MHKISIPTLGLVVAMSSSAFAAPIFGNDSPEVDSTEEGSQSWIKQARPGFGARVGGYGFRDPSGETKEWNDCRMNGFGVFATADATPHLFGELSVDFYQATQETLQEGMDRESRHFLAAAGLRMFPDLVFTPYVQLGGGAEWTHVRIGGAQNERVFGMAFLGIGAELNVTRELKLGGNLRMLATAQPAHESETHGAGTALSRQPLTTEHHHDAELRLGVAAQGQFFVRYAL